MIALKALEEAIGQIEAAGAGGSAFAKAVTAYLLEEVLDGLAAAWNVPAGNADTRTKIEALKAEAERLDAEGGG